MDLYPLEISPSEDDVGDWEPVVHDVNKPSWSNSEHLSELN